MKSLHPYVKKIVKALKWAGIVFVALILIILIIVFAARTINTMTTKITTDNGIQEDKLVTLGGIEQAIQIRGEDIDNPIILFLHGGPGSPHAFVSYNYQSELQANYTIVNWDQRGSGRTYYANPTTRSTANLSPDMLSNDLNDLVDYLINRFGQEQVIVMGHSWGTILGSMYVQQYPEKVAAYIGIGQCINLQEGEALAAREASKLATEDNDEQYVENLANLTDQLESAESFADFEFTNHIKMRELTAQYLSRDTIFTTLRMFWLGASSPDMSFKDLKWFMVPIFAFDEFYHLLETLFEYTFFGFDIYDHPADYDVPVYFISGDSDWITPYPLVEEYYEKLKAPDKEIIFIKNAGHSPFMDNPEAFTSAVMEVLDRRTR